MKVFYAPVALCGLTVFLVARVNGYDNIEDFDELDNNNEFMMSSDEIAADEYESGIQSGLVLGWGPSYHHDIDFDIHRDPQQQDEHIHDEFMELLDPQGVPRRGGGRRGGGGGRHRGGGRRRGERRGDEMEDFHHLEDDHGLMSDEIHQVDNDYKMELLRSLVWEWRRRAVCGCCGRKY